MSVNQKSLEFVVPCFESSGGHIAYPELQNRLYNLQYASEKYCQNIIKCFHIRFEINQFYIGDRILIFGYYLQMLLMEKLIVTLKVTHEESKTNTVDNVLLLKQGNVDICALSKRKRELCTKNIQIPLSNKYFGFH